jgi:hypothetical protein
VGIQMTRSSHVIIERLDRDHRDRVCFVLEPPGRPAKPTEFKQRMWVLVRLRELGYFAPTRKEKGRARR